MDPSLLSFAGPSGSSSFRPPSYLNQNQNHNNNHSHTHNLNNQHPNLPISDPSQYPHIPSNPSFDSSTSSSSPGTLDGNEEGNEDEDDPSSAYIAGNRQSGGGVGGTAGGSTREIHTGPLVRPHQELNEFLETFWTRQMDNVEREEHDGKGNVSLPLARIKKVMKSDEDVKMISAEVPIMFSKACEIFISELTCRAWLVAESHKRRTLQKSDVATAIAFSDMFDFLIDIVPREGEGSGGNSKAQSPGEVEGEGEGDGDGDEEEGEGEGGEGDELPDGVDGRDRQDGQLPSGGGGEGEEELYREFMEGEG